MDTAFLQVLPDWKLVAFEILVRGYETDLPIYLLSRANMTSLCGDDPAIELSGPYGMLVGVRMALCSTK